MQARTKLREEEVRYLFEVWAGEVPQRGPYKEVEDDRYHFSPMLSTNLGNFDNLVLRHATW